MTLAARDHYAASGFDAEVVVSKNPPDERLGALVISGPIPAPLDVKTGDFMRTDLGNARRFADDHINSARYCKLYGKWFLFDGSRWAEDNQNAVMDLARQTVGKMYRVGIMARDDDTDQGVAVLKHAAASESVTRMRAMLELAATLPGIRVEPNDFDRDPFLFNVLNGTLDLRGGHVVIRKHDPGDLITKVAPVVYDRSVGESRWWNDTTRANMNADDELVAFLRRADGSALTGESRQKTILIHHGLHDNGKTTRGRVLLDLFGDYGLQVEANSLVARKGHGIPNDIADLKGVRFAIASETERGAALAEAKLKNLAGNNMLTGERKFHEPFRFPPTHDPLNIETNHLPRASGDKALWSRVKLVKWQVVIPEEQRLPMTEVLRIAESERTGILNWLIAGYEDFYENGLQAPKAVQVATDEYREDSDDLGAFIDEVFVAAEDASILLHDFFNAYKFWAAENGYTYTYTSKALARELRDRGIDVHNGAANKVTIFGLQKRPSDLVEVPV